MENVIAMVAYLEELELRFDGDLFQVLLMSISVVGHSARHDDRRVWLGQGC